MCEVWSLLLRKFMYKNKFLYSELSYPFLRIAQSVLPPWQTCSDSISTFHGRIQPHATINKLLVYSHALSYTAE